jgi:UDP-glucuronate 4-epimerase
MLIPLDEQKHLSVLVTGNCGFVGRHIIKALDECNVSWYGCDLEEARDIRNLQELDRLFDSHHFTDVIHLAALTGVRRSEEYSEEYIRTNISGTKNIVKMCEKHGVESLIFFSSSSVYGNGTPPIMETSPMNPISLYGITKLTGEEIVRASSVPQRTIIVPFTIFGEEGRRDSVIYKWIDQYSAGKPITVFGDGKTRRGYVYIKDLVDCLIEIIGNKRAAWSCEKFNLGGAEVIELETLLKIFQNHIPDLNFVRLPLRGDDIAENFADISKAKNMLGFNPQECYARVVKKIIKKELGF